MVYSSAAEKIGSNMKFWYAAPGRVETRNCVKRIRICPRCGSRLPGARSVAVGLAGQGISGILGHEFRAWFNRCDHVDQNPVRIVRDEVPLAEWFVA